MSVLVANDRNPYGFRYGFLLRVAEFVRIPTFAASTLKPRIPLRHGFSTRHDTT